MSAIGWRLLLNRHWPANCCRRAFDPHFERTVILIVKHDRDGAVGIVIDKPIGETSIASVLEALGQKDDGVTGEVRVFSGGPVQPEVGFVVHTADYNRPETVAVTDRVSITSSLDILRDIAAKKGPAKGPRGLRLRRLGTRPA